MIIDKEANNMKDREVVLKVLEARLMSAKDELCTLLEHTAERLFITAK